MTLICLEFFGRVKSENNIFFFIVSELFVCKIQLFCRSAVLFLRSILVFMNLPFTSKKSIIYEFVVALKFIYEFVVAPEIHLRICCRTGNPFTNLLSHRNSFTILLSHRKSIYFFLLLYFYF